MSWLSVQMRRLADARAATGGLVALAFVTALLFAAAPRAIDDEADRALRSTVAAATADTRNVAVSQTGRMSTGSPDPLAVVAATGDQFDEAMPPSVAELISSRYIAVDTARFRPQGLEGRTVRMRYLQDATSHIRFVAGTLPSGDTSQLPVEPGSIAGAVTAFNRDLPPPTSLATFEVAVSVDSAANLHVGVGDILKLRTDQTDKLAGFSVAVVAIRIVGIYSVVNGSDDFWFGDTSLEKPQVRSISPLNQIDDITVLTAASAYPALVNTTAEVQLPFRYTWRYPVETSRLRTNGIEALQKDLRRLESAFIATGVASGSSWNGVIGEMSPPALQSGLLSLVKRYAAGWRSVSQVLSIAEVGGAAVALLALSLVCLLAGRRRAGSLATWQNRGASRRRILAAAAAEIVIELALPVAAGAAVAVAVVPGPPVAPSAAAAGAVFVFAAALVLINTISGATDPAAKRSGAGNGDGGGRKGRSSEGGRGLAAFTRGASARRLVLELVVVLAAVAGAYILRQRGVEAAGSNVVQASPDPLLAAVPALIGGAAALAVARLLPLPLDLLARVAERGRGLVALLAFRRATRRTNDRLLLTTLLTMATVWAFAAVSLAYLGRAGDAASWNTVGGDYRITLRDGSIPDNLGLAELPGVERVAESGLLSGHLPDSNAQYAVLAIDLAAFRDVAAGGWLADSIPSSMLAAEPPAPTLGKPGSPIPVIISETLADEGHLAVNDAFEFIVSGARPSFVVVAVRATFATMPEGVGWMVVSRPSLTPVVAGRSIPATQVFIRANEAAGTAIAATLQARLPGQGFLVSRYDTGADLRGSPEYVAVVFGLAAASLVAAAYGALAILGALLLAGAEQSRESAHLRVLGLSRLQNLGLSLIEHGPASILVIGTGIALGCGLFMFLQSSLGLGQLVGGDIDVGLPIEAGQVAVIFLATGAIVGLAVALETVAESIIKPTAALRRGMD